MRKNLRGDRNQCPTCGEYFNSTRAFDKHRVGNFAPPERRCLTPEEMTNLKKPMVKRKDGFWVTEPMPENASRRVHANEKQTFSEQGNPTPHTL